MGIENEDFFKVQPRTLDLIITSPPYIGIGKDYNESLDYESVIKHIDKFTHDRTVIAWQVGNTVTKGFIEPIDILTYQYFTELGYKMINRVVWHFGHGLHCKNRFSHRYETINFYSKSKDYTFNLDAVRVPSKYPNKKHYKGPKKGQLSGNPLGKNPEDVWSIPNIKHNHPEKTAHPCQFPEALVDRIVLAFSSEADEVMDPFMGSGTVGVVCKKRRRKFYGVEMDKRWFDVAVRRIEEA